MIGAGVKAGPVARLHNRRLRTAGEVFANFSTSQKQVATQPQAQYADALTHCNWFGVLLTNDKALNTLTNTTVPQLCIIDMISLL